MRGKLIMFRTKSSFFYNLKINLSEDFLIDFSPPRKEIQYETFYFIKDILPSEENNIEYFNNNINYFNKESHIKEIYNIFKSYLPYVRVTKLYRLIFHYIYSSELIPFQAKFIQDNSNIGVILGSCYNAYLNKTQAFLSFRFSIGLL